MVQQYSDPQYPQKVIDLQSVIKLAYTVMPRHPQFWMYRNRDALIHSEHAQARLRRETAAVIQDIVRVSGLPKCVVVRQCIEAGVGRVAQRHADHLIRASQDVED